MNPRPNRPAPAQPLPRRRAAHLAPPAWALFAVSLCPANPPTQPETPLEPATMLVESIPIATPLDSYSAHEIGGFSVLVDPELLARPKEWRRVRAALIFDLSLIAERLSPPALGQVIGVPIVVTRDTPPRPDWDGASAACMHASEQWLTSHGYDAARTGVVEILHADRYLLWRAEQPMMLLHELAHAHHLHLGYDDPRFIDAFDHARAAGLYESVDYVMAPDAPPRRAYAASNPQEYFAEITEAYFGRNDFAPFSRDDLRAYDPVGCALVEEVWLVDAPSPGESR